MRTYYTILTCLLLLLGKLAAAQGHNLYFSKYVEGSGYDKALEIYNPKDYPVDLKYYKIEVDTDGKGFGSGQRVSAYQLKGTLAPHTSYLMVREVSTNEELKFLADTTLRSNILNFNGNEQIRLREYNGYQDDDPYDMVDQIGYPGSTNNMKNVTLVRKSQYAPNMGRVGSAVTDEWIKKPFNDLSCLKLAPGSTNLGGTIDKTKTVGSIVGNATVNLSGAATYNIPIPALPGINGMEPKISITYNSQSGNGLLGKSWNLSGLSAITRIPQTKYHDNKVKPVNLSIDDRFALDGNRLITSGTYGTSNAQYRTEVETFSKITALGSGLSSYFKVETKDGRILEYGRSDDSKVKLTGESQVMMWYLNKVTDINGNTIVYNYQQSGGSSWINSIQYAGNTIQFTYSTNRIPIVQYIKGHKITTQKILTNIDVKRSGITFYGYRLGYYKNRVNNIDELVAITKYNSTGQELNSTKIKWERDLINAINIQNVSVEKSPYNDSFLDQVYTAGDIDGDGISEIVSVFPYKKYYAPGAYSNHTAWQVYDPNNTSSVNVNFKASSQSLAPPSINMGSIKTYNTGINYGDFLAEGKNDIIMPYWDLTFGNSVYFDFVNKPGKGIQTKVLDGKTMPLYTIDDINSNGRSEIIYLQTSTTLTPSYKGAIIEVEADNNTLSRKDFTLNLQVGQHIRAVPKQIIVNDYNSDGYKDLLVLTKDGTFIFKGDGNTFLSNGVVFIQSLVDCKIIKQGDFNGDGQLDLLFANTNGELIKFAYGKGNGTFDIRTYSGILGLDDRRTTHDNDEDNILIVDFNHDGRSDFISINSIQEYDGHLIGHDYDYVRTDIRYYESTGYGFQLIRTKTFRSATYSNKKFFVTGDFDGDGRVDVLNYGYGLFNTGNHGQLGWHLCTSPYDQDYTEGLVSEIKNGFGISSIFKYAPLTQEDIYTKGTSKITDVLNFQGPLYVTSSLELPDGLYGTVCSNYHYKDAKIHLKGKGFLGFQETQVVNALTNKKEIRYFEIDGKHFNTALKKLEVKTVSGQMISSLENSNITRDLGNKRILPYVERSINKDIKKDVTITTDFRYDDYANLKKKTTSYGGDATIVIDNLYETKGAWCPSRLSKSTVSKTYSNESVFTRITNYKYYSNGNLEYELSNGVKTSYTYDTYGNPDIVTASASGETSRVTNFDYDPSHRFISKKTNPLGQVETFRCNDWGQITEQTDIAGKKTSYRYDKWGQLVEMMNPNGTLTDYNTQWAEDNNFGALYYTYSSNEESPYLKTYYDALGREIQTETEGFNGKIYTNKKYNRKGELIKSLSEHYSGGNAKLTCFEYDTYGRLIASSLNGVKSTFGYSGLTNDVNTPTGNSSKTYNKVGDVISATDNGGTINYKYHSSGQAKSITSNESTVSMTYYPDGKQKTLSDPDAGTIAYVYDGWGEIKTQTDARGNNTSIKYDKLGRITQKTCGGLVSDYRYYTTGKQIGLLQKVICSNNTSTSYTYNSFAQPIIIDENIQGKVFRTSYSYDDYGRVNSIAYPSGFTVTQHYNTNGYLTEVKRADNGKSIWKASSVEANGQVKSFVSGNGKWTHKTFNNDGYLTSIKSDYGRIQNLSYKFDKERGNLLERKDARAGRIETFTYDNLNRLTSSKVGADIQSFQYDKNGKGNGNITFKTHVGSYEYDNVEKGPHAVSGISNDDGLVKTEQNVEYTAFNKVSQIEQKPYRMNFVYGHDFARRKTDLFKDNSKVMTKYFVGNYEQKDMGSKSYKISYIMGGDGLAAIHIMGANVPEMTYVHKDHLGSIQALSCDNLNQNNGIIDELAYDAWGKRIYTDEPGFNNDLNYQNLCRGYTGHEHLPEFGLINMNGRLYDPLLGRFLSPDNYVQMPDFTQNFNRFGYCLNNPLIYSDPTGEFWHIVIGAAIGGIINVATHWKQIHSFKDGAMAFGIGALAGGLGAATGGTAFIAAGGASGGAGGILAGIAGGAMGSATSMPVQSLGNAIYFGDPLMTPEQFVMGVAAGAALGGVINGGIAAANGRSIWSGTVKPSNIGTPTVELPAPALKNEIKLPNGGRSEIKNAAPNNNRFTVSTRQQDVTFTTSDGVKLTISRPEVNGYHSSLVEKTNLYHNFPRALDETIINGGDWAQRLKDGAQWFQAPGTINGAKGFYQIGINDKGVIFHRNFVPLK